MANQEHLDILNQGVEVWNQWRREHPDILPDLTRAKLSYTHLIGANLTGANLRGAALLHSHLSNADLSNAKLIDASLFKADLSHANLTGANLSNTEMTEVNLSGATLVEANLSHAKLIDANLFKADLIGANLRGATLFLAHLSDADLSNADLRRTILVRTNFTGAILTGCQIYGIAAWNVELIAATQNNLVITPEDEPIITVDSLKIAQFIYLLLNNAEIRDVINTIGQKGVLILGRFSKERKAVLDALRDKLRTLNFLPIVFDFERPAERDFTETIMTLAGLSCFIIADITNPKSSPLELQATVPNYMIPFVPIIQQGEQPFSMFQDLKGKYDWVLDILVYDTPSNLIKGLERAVVIPALEMRDVLLSKKMEQLQTRHIEDYL